MPHNDPPLTFNTAFNFPREAQLALQRGEPELADYFLRIDAGLLDPNTPPPYPPGQRPLDFGATPAPVSELAPPVSQPPLSPTDEPSDSFLDVLEEILGGLNAQPATPSTPITVGGGEAQARLNLDAFEAAQRAEVARQQVATNLLGFLGEVQQNPFSIVPALQSFSAAGGGTNALGEAFAATGGQGMTSPFGPAVDALIQSLLGFSLTPPADPATPPPLSAAPVVPQGSNLIDPSSGTIKPALENIIGTRPTFRGPSGTPVDLTARGPAPSTSTQSFQGLPFSRTARSLLRTMGV